jgi:DNA replication protein DnaC
MQSMKQVSEKIFGKNAFKTKVIGDCKTCSKPIIEVSGTYPEFMPSNLAGKVYKSRKCGCEDLALARAAEESHKRMLQKKILHIFEQHSIMNEKQKGSTLAAFEPDTETQQKAFQITKDFIADVTSETPTNVLLSGSYGIGKSHLAAAACHEITKAGKTAIFINVPKLLTKFKSTYRKDSEFTEDQLLHMLETVDALVLDDLGANKATDWTDEMLFQIIDSRQGKATFYTTNLTGKELVQLIGDRNMERIKTDTKVLRVEGRSRRDFIAEKDWGF